MGSRESSATQLVTAPASAGADDWRTRLRRAVYSLYREPAALPVGGEIDELADLIDEGRDEPQAPPTLTRVTAEALGGAIFHELCLAARPGALPPETELVPMLMYSAVLPYMGTDGAAEELRIPPPPR